MVELALELVLVLVVVDFWLRNSRFASFNSLFCVLLFAVVIWFREFADFGAVSLFSFWFWLFRLCCLMLCVSLCVILLVFWFCVLLLCV